MLRKGALCLRFSDAIGAPDVAATRTLRRVLDEQAVAFLALPPHPRAGLPPDTSSLVQSALQLDLTVSVRVARVPVGPFAELGGVPGALDAAHMATLLADSGGRRDEQEVALVADASDALLGGLVGQLAAGLGGDGQELLLLGSHGAVPFPLLALFARSLLLGVAGTLFAALVLTLGADLVGAKGGRAVVTGAVDAHANRFLDALHVDGFGRRGDPLVRLQGKAVFGEQSAGTLLLKSTAVEFLGDGIGAPGSGGRGRRGSRCWSGTVQWLARIGREGYIGVGGSVGDVGVQHVRRGSWLALLLGGRSSGSGRS